MQLYFGMRSIAVLNLFLTMCAPGFDLNSFLFHEPGHIHTTDISTSLYMYPLIEPVIHATDVYISMFLLLMSL